MFQKKAGRRWTWKSPNCVTKTEADYILTNRPDIVTDVIVISQVNIGSDHRMAMSNIKLDLEKERRTIMTKSRCHTNRFNEDRIPTRIEKLIQDTTITKRHRHHERNHHRQQSSSTVAKAISKSSKSMILSPTRCDKIRRGNMDTHHPIKEQDNLYIIYMSFIYNLCAYYHRNMYAKVI